MFDFFRRKKQRLVFSPVDGNVIHLKEVGDGVFSEKMVGDGVAVIPSGNEVMAPVDGIVSFVMETGHALGIQIPDGPEILIHIGIDTVNEKGKGFEVLVEANQKVTVGTLMVRIDREALIEKGYNLATMVLIPEVEKYGTLEIKEEGGVCAGKQAILGF